MTPAPGSPRYPSYDSTENYNAAHPDAQMPLSLDARNVLRSFTCAGAGLEDDIAGSGASCTLDFLPGGAPEATQPDQVGTVVASQWGNPPYRVLADRVSLRQAWTTITTRWPAALSAAATVLDPLPRHPATDPSA